MRASSSSADTACWMPISRSASRTEAELTRAVIGRPGACLRNITALTSTSPSLVPMTRACWAPSGLADLTVAGGRVTADHVHAPADPARVDVGGQHNRNPGRRQFLKDRGHGRAHPEDDPVGARREAVFHAEYPPDSGDRGRARHEREHCGQQRDRRQHDSRGNHASGTIVRRHVTVPHRGRGGNGPVRGSGERDVLTQREQAAPASTHAAAASSRNATCRRRRSPKTRTRRVITPHMMPG